MRRVHIVGRKNQGKTTLLTKVLRELTERGVRVGVFKHSKHTHELDCPGKDSHRLRQAGGVPSAVVSEELVAVFFPADADVDPYQRLASLYSDCDLVLVEGDIEARATKVEIWRESVGKPPIAGERDDIVALITDDPVDLEIPRFPLSDIPVLCDRLLELMEPPGDER